MAKYDEYVRVYLVVISKSLCNLRRFISFYCFMVQAMYQRSVGNKYQQPS